MFLALREIKKVQNIANALKHHDTKTRTDLNIDTLFFLQVPPLAAATAARSCIHRVPILDTRVHQLDSSHLRWVLSSIYFYGV